MDTATTPQPIAPPPLPPPAPQIVPTATAFPDLSARMKETLSRYRMRWVSFLSLSAVYLVIPAALAILFVLFGATLARLVGAGDIMATMIGGISLLLAFATILLLSTAMTVAICSSAAFKTPLFSSLRSAMHYTLPAFVASLIAMCATSLGSVLFIIPGIILGLRFSLYIPVILNERRSGMEALLRSRDLVYGKTGKLFFEMLIVSLAMGFLNGTIAGGLSFALSLFLPETLKAMGVPEAIGTFVGALALIPFGFIYLQIFYEHASAGEKHEWAPNPRLATRYKIMAGIGALFFVAMPILTVLAASQLPIFNGTADAPVVDTTEDTKEATTPALSDGQRRDLERYRAMTELRVALSSYARARSEYPETLDVLSPDFIGTVPTDPLTELAYPYERTEYGYLLHFTIEEGTDDLYAGEHTLGKDGFDPAIAGETAPAEQEPTIAAVMVGGEALPEEVEATLPDSGNDADNDGLGDEYEIANGLDPNSDDTDRDGLTDTQELRRIGTDPRVADTDDDGFGDGEELYGGFDPLLPDAVLPDLDGDGLANLYEELHGYDGGDPDMDNDGLSDGDELRVFATDPRVADTDGDGFTDTSELGNGFEPLGEGSLTPFRLDEIRSAKAKYGTHPPTDPALFAS